MFDFSYLDPKLLFPNITEGWESAIDSFSNLLSIVSIILIIVAEWKLFKKFGEKPWKSLVPYYNSYILYKHSWSKKAFWIYFLSSTLFNICHGISSYLADNVPDSMWMTLLVLISLPFGIIAAVCSVLYAFRLAEAFGKGKIFSVGLMLMYSVFIAILGIGKVKYIGNGDSIQSEAEANVPQSEGEVV